jgi:hypothetical protein
VHLRRLRGWVCDIVEIFFGFVALGDSGLWKIEYYAERSEAKRVICSQHPSVRND